VAKKSYKDMNLYSCIVLNLLASALGIDPQQKDLDGKLDLLLHESKTGLSKSEIMHHIRSNHNMTERILNHLKNEDYIDIDKDERTYKVLPTKKGLLHVGEFNKFYASIYSKQIEDHYRYIGLPAWYRKHRD
jgi:predicted transcriptional regulator